MKTSCFFSLVLALFVASGAVGAPLEGVVEVAARAADNNFLGSCSGTTVNVQTVILTTTCRTPAGVGITQSISLDSCIANANGQLVARNNGGFSGSCPDRTFIGTSAPSAFLDAQCKNDAGNLVSTSIDLNTVFTNVNGVLTCP